MERGKGNHQNQKETLMFQLVLKSAATAMMQDAYWWYEEQKEGLGEDFLTELESCFCCIPH
jgi:hypothetical protein